MSRASGAGFRIPGSIRLERSHKGLHSEPEDLNRKVTGVRGSRRIGPKEMKPAPGLDIPLCTYKAHLNLPMTDVVSEQGRKSRPKPMKVAKKYDSSTRF